MEKAGKEKAICESAETAKTPAVLHRYEENFHPASDYLSSLPDVQNADRNTINGANVPIMQVGMHNFKLPLKVLTGDCQVREVEASVTGTVSLSADAKGVNMSRIMRVFYLFADRIFTPELLEEILVKMKEQVKTSRARIKISFDYPILQTSLRSNLKGWQYYKCAYEGTMDDLDIFRKFVYFDFVYSSACPCSSELSEHARRTRNVYCVPHSQRSKARISAEIEKSAHISIEDLHNICRKALHTETQVMVRREDEQAFAELNGAYVKFIEDATRLLYAEFNRDKRIKDFEIACIHLESLHSHDAVGVICKGLPGGFKADFSDFEDLVC